MNTIQVHIAITTIAIATTHSERDSKQSIFIESFGEHVSLPDQLVSEKDGVHQSLPVLVLPFFL